MQNWISKKKKTKKKKETQVFQNFRSVGKGQTNIFFLGLIIRVHSAVGPTEHKHRYQCFHATTMYQDL